MFRSSHSTQAVIHCEVCCAQPERPQVRHQLGVRLSAREPLLGILGMLVGQALNHGQCLTVGHVSLFCAVGVYLQEAG